MKGLIPVVYMNCMPKKMCVTDVERNMQALKKEGRMNDLTRLLSHVKYGLYEGSDVSKVSGFILEKYGFQL
jgi:hypothetical protein